MSLWCKIRVRLCRIKTVSYVFKCSYEHISKSKISDLLAKKLFGINKPIIGALHFTPLMGYKGFKTLDAVLSTAAADLQEFEKGGIDAIIIENNYDQPHKIIVGPETVASMTLLGCEIRRKTRLPLGVSVLWNDYKAAFSIAKAIGASFIRVPVFVDSVKTKFGTIMANPKEVVDYRRSIGAQNVMIFADIQVKHAKPLTKKRISESAKQAQRQGADAIIVTGKWTGNAPDVEKLREAKESVRIPVIIGSGLDVSNAKALLKYADSAIVSTSLKTGGAVRGERNVKPYSSRVSRSKVKELMDAVKGIRA